MSRWSEELWLRNLDTDDLKRARKAVETGGFWAYVDSSQRAYTHPGECRTLTHPVLGERNVCTDWTHVRGDGCLAANGSLTQCGQQPLDGVPFCAMHFDEAWLAIATFVSTERIDAIARHAEFEAKVEARARFQSIAESIAIDARRLLEKSPERVYFFAADDCVKVGRSTSPEKRVRNFGTTLAPEGVDVRSGALLGTIPGGSAVERSLHQEFRPHRIVGEWFTLPPIRERITELVDALAAPTLADTA